MRERLPIRLDDSSEFDANELNHIARYEFAASFCEGKEVLDCACGVGYGSALMERSGAEKVVGVDISEEAIMFACDHYESDISEFRRMSVYDLSGLPEFDLVVSFETIEHLERPGRFLEQVAQKVRPDGVFIVSTPNRRSGRLTERPKNEFHLREWTVEEFEGLLSGFFDEITSFGQCIDYANRNFPGNRTIASVLSRILDPKVAAIIRKPEVHPIPDRSCFALRPGNVISICRRPIR